MEKLVLMEDEDGWMHACPMCKTDGYLIDVSGDIEEVYSHTIESIEIWKYAESIKHDSFS